MNAPSSLEKPRVRIRKRRTASKPVVHALQELTILGRLRALWNAIRRAAHPFHLRRAGRRLQALETLSLGDKRSVLLVRVDGQEFLLGATDKALSLLAKLDRPREKQKVTSLRTSPQVEELVANFNSSVQ